MENEEKASELGNKYETPCHGVGDCEFEAKQAALEAMAWKDEQFAAEKQALIDNACEWLTKNYQNLDYINMEGDLFDLSMVEDFRKAMEGMK